jgi:hypothetical protein
MNIYGDGTLAASRFIGPTFVAFSAANFRISGDDNGNVHFAGLIDEVAVFNRALSAKEIQSLYNGVTVSVPASQSATATPTVAPRASLANLAPLASSLLGLATQAASAAPAPGSAAPSASPANPSSALPIFDWQAAVPAKAADVVFGASVALTNDDNSGLFAPSVFRGVDAL